MKWIIASDIHGSAYYCQRLLEAARAEKADRMLLLGDILYHGPRNDLPREYDTKAVTAMLNSSEIPITAVRGNCDAEIDQTVLSFPIMADYVFISSGSAFVFATHGHHYNLESLPKMNKGDILLHGHTHVTACVEEGGIVYMNPGSVSIPKEGTANGYITLEDGLFIWKNIDGAEIMRYSK